MYVYHARPVMSELSDALDNLKASVKNLMQAIEKHVESHEIRNLAAAVVISLAALEEILRRQDPPHP